MEKMEVKAEKIRMAKAKEWRSEGRTRGEEKIKGAEGREKAEERKDNENKESSRGVEDLEWRRRNSMIGERSKEVDQGLWEESEWGDAKKKDMGQCN